MFDIGMTPSTSISLNDPVSAVSPYPSTMRLVNSLCLATLACICWCFAPIFRILALFFFCASNWPLAERLERPKHPLFWPNTRSEWIAVIFFVALISAIFASLLFPGAFRYLSFPDPHFPALDWMDKHPWAGACVLGAMHYATNIWKWRRLRLRLLRGPLAARC